MGVAHPTMEMNHGGPPKKPMPMAMNQNIVPHPKLIGWAYMPWSKTHPFNAVGWVGRGSLIADFRQPSPRNPPMSPGPADCLVDVCACYSQGNQLVWSRFNHTLALIFAIRSPSFWAKKPSSPSARIRPGAPILSGDPCISKGSFGNRGHFHKTWTLSGNSSPGFSIWGPSYCFRC